MRAAARDCGGAGGAAIRAGGGGAAGLPIAEAGEAGLPAAAAFPGGGAAPLTGGIGIAADDSCRVASDEDWLAIDEFDDPALGSPDIRPGGGGTRVDGGVGGRWESVIDHLRVKDLQNAEQLGLQQTA